MIHLHALRRSPPLPTIAHQYPFTVPVIQSLTELEFTAPVTFFVGENGSGKSTLLEAIACAANLPTAGSASADKDSSLEGARQLARHLRLSWRHKKKRGFFLRAEDFFGYVKRMNQTRSELEREMKAVDEEYVGRSETAKGLAKMPYARELSDMERRYGKDLDAYSHGEIFLKFFASRFVPEGLYLLDEPEAPLSPLRQLAFLAAAKQMVAQEGQLIIATHSPLLLAFPEAVIYSFDSVPIQPVAYDDLEHVRLTRDFLNNPARFLHQL
jgi:predicted ATPase